MYQSFALEIDTERWVDLTYPLSPETPMWPGLPKMRVNEEQSNYGKSWPGQPWDGIYLAARHIEFYEHIGTHIDLPSHFKEGAKSEHEMELKQLVGHLVVVDVTQKVKVQSVISQGPLMKSFVLPGGS